MVDVSVVVRGAPWLLEAVEEALEGAQGILMDLSLGLRGCTATALTHNLQLLPLVLTCL